MNAREIAIAPSTSIRFALTPFEIIGKPAAASIEPPIEIKTSQRQGNCVSCSGLNNIQTGRLSGNDINKAKSVKTMTGVL